MKTDISAEIQAENFQNKKYEYEYDTNHCMATLTLTI
jgi:hypothetical protein